MSKRLSACILMMILLVFPACKQPHGGIGVINSDAIRNEISNQSNHHEALTAKDFSVEYNGIRLSLGADMESFDAQFVSIYNNTPYMLKIDGVEYPCYDYTYIDEDDRKIVVRFSNMYNKKLGIDENRLIAYSIECESAKAVTDRGLHVSDKMNDINAVYPQGHLGHGVMASTVSFEMEEYRLNFVGDIKNPDYIGKIRLLFTFAYAYE